MTARARSRRGERDCKLEYKRMFAIGFRFRSTDRPFRRARARVRLILSIPLGLMAVVPILAAPGTVQAASCSGPPVGQANPSAEPEPMVPIWCASGLTAQPTVRVLDQAGGWVDQFQTGTQMGRLSDGEMGYRVFNSLTSTGHADNEQVPTQHFVNNNHWMVDMARNNGGAALSPNTSFRFQNGKLVLEADVAAGIPGYGTSSTGDLVWPEVTWSSAPAPTGNVSDNLYLYGQFGGAWASGCRLSARRGLTCALEADHDIGDLVTGDQPPCFSVGPSRLMELSGFQGCGSTHEGGAVEFGAPEAAWRLCDNNQMDMFCRDRFRLEWTKSSLVVYVNGIKFMEDSGWPSARQIPDAIVSGQVPVYAYFGEWGDFSDDNIYRFHWGRVAVNPHTATGALMGPSAAPSYCPDHPASTCPMESTNPMPGETGGPTPPMDNSHPAPMPPMDTPMPPTDTPNQPQMPPMITPAGSPAPPVGHATGADATSANSPMHGTAAGQTANRGGLVPDESWPVIGAVGMAGPGMGGTGIGAGTVPMDMPPTVTGHMIASRPSGWVGVLVWSVVGLLVPGLLLGIYLRWRHMGRPPRRT